VGLRVEPAAPGSGITFSPGIEPGRLPIAFINALDRAQYLRQVAGRS